jgi:hypothetical protein
MRRAPMPDSRKKRGTLGAKRRRLRNARRAGFEGRGCVPKRKERECHRRREDAGRDRSQCVAKVGRRIRAVARRRVLVADVHESSVPVVVLERVQQRSLPGGKEGDGEEKTGYPGEHGEDSRPS